MNDESVKIKKIIMITIVILKIVDHSNDINENKKNY